jgi:hypothetical protein
MKTQESEFVCKYNREILEDADQEHDAVAKSKRYGQYERSGKSMIECICPCCGILHTMKLHWSGRGIPRKFCEDCRERETQIDR